MWGKQSKQQAKAAKPSWQKKEDKNYFDVLQALQEIYSNDICRYEL